MPCLDHRQLGVDLFNHTWTFLDQEERTPDEDDAMIHAAYASRYHWSQASQEAKHQARGEWQLARVFAVLGRGEPAVYHGERCLEWCGRGEVEDWDVAFAHEALARAHKAAGTPRRRSAQAARARGGRRRSRIPRTATHFDKDWPRRF